jgi:hypothetical protein
MDAPVTVAIVSAAAAVVVPAISFYLTKSKERRADWQRYKFDLHKELVQSLNLELIGDRTRKLTPEMMTLDLRRVHAAQLLPSVRQ